MKVSYRSRKYSKLLFFNLFWAVACFFFFLHWLKNTKAHQQPKIFFYLIFHGEPDIISWCTSATRRLVVYIIEYRINIWYIFFFFFLFYNVLWPLDSLVSSFALSFLTASSLSFCLQGQRFYWEKPPSCPTSLVCPRSSPCSSLLSWSCGQQYASIHQGSSLI